MANTFDETPIDSLYGFRIRWRAADVRVGQILEEGKVTDNQIFALACGIPDKIGM
jgi:hypothetical protein